MNEIALEQRGGIGSSNTQIIEQNNHYGLSYTETKSLCIDLVKTELDLYRDQALQIAIEREERLRNSILEKLESEINTDSTILDEFKNPDLQYAYVNAQKSYIRVGTSELENILSDLLFKRIKENNRTLLQLTLNESLNTVSMLLPEQMHILTICFLLRYTKRKHIVNHDTLIQYITSVIMPHVTDGLKKLSLFQHLEYTRCGQVNVTQLSLEQCLLNTYKGLFCKGIQLDLIESLKEKYSSLFLPCLNDSKLWQVNAIDEATLNAQLQIVDATEDKEKILNFFNNYTLSENEVNETITGMLPSACKLFDIWNDSNIKNFTLTSVGIVIGATFSKQVTGSTYDLSIWI